MMTAYEEKRAYANEIGPMREEPPLAGRLEELLGILERTLRVIEELHTGPVPEKAMSIDRPVVGVLMLGAECQKAASALENRVLEVAKRIGRM